ncbi:MAG: PQQ-binding-like beta-propeller repeat protein [Myxococcales bacterium]|nr:PQQ-binding-like beta-propeller repeat protein [Myxococcales bacterium]
MTRGPGLVALLLAAGTLCGGCAALGLPGDETPLTGATRNLQPVPMRPAWRRVLNPPDIMRDRPSEFAGAAYDPKSNRVVVGAGNGFVQCMRASDGHVLWRRRIAGGVGGRAVFDDRQVIVGTDDGELVALDVVDGEVRWRYDVEGAVVRAPVVAGGLVVFVDGTNVVYAIDRATGEWRWQYRRDPPADFSLAGESRPTVAGDRVFVGFSDGVLAALALSDGAVLWTRDLAPEHERFQDVDTTPVVERGRVYAASAAAGLYALDAESGDVMWQRPGAGIVELTGVDGDLLASVDRGELVRIDTHNGTARWRVRFPGTSGTPGSVAQHGNLAIVGLSRGGLYWIDLPTGRPIRRFTPGSGLIGAPAVGSDGSLFVLSNGGVFYAFRPPPATEGA